MQVKDKRIFEQATLNLDKDQRNLSINEYPYIENCIDLVYNNATLTALTNNYSNKLVEYDLSSKGVDTVIGSYEWKEKETVIYFLHNAQDGHSILSYDNKTKIITPILKHEIVLNFNINYKINSVSVFNDMLLWTDNYNEPRSIIIDKAKKYTASKRYLIQNVQAETLGGVNWTKLSINNTTGLSIGTKIYIKQSSDNYYNGIATILSVGINEIVIDKGWLTPTLYGYFYIYDGNNQYYELSEHSIRFIKKPPVKPPIASYSTKIAEGQKHTLIISDFTYDANLVQLKFTFTSVLSGNGINVVFAKNPSIGQYQLTTDLEYIVSTIANVLSNSILPETISENGILKIYSSSLLPDIEFRLESIGYGQHEINGTFSDESFTVSNNQQIVTLTKSPLEAVAYQKSNSLRGRYFNVYYRWKYDDKSYSVFSSGIKSVLPIGDITVEGRYTENEYLNNILNISFDAGTDEVEQIEIAITTNEVPDNPYIIERIYKYDTSGNHILKNKHEKYKSDDTYTYEFNNTNYGINVSDTEVKRLFDNVPLKAKNLTVLDTRNAVFSNYTDGYNNVNIKSEISVGSKEYALTQQNIFTVSQQLPYDLNGIRYRQITYTFNQTILQENTTYKILINFEVGSVALNQDWGNSKTISLSYSTRQGDTYEDMLDYFVQKIKEFLVTLKLSSPKYNDITLSTVFRYNNTITISLIYDSVNTLYKYGIINVSAFSSSFVIDSTFKSGATHYFAVRYYDLSGRCGADNPASSIYVPVKTEELQQGGELDDRIIKNTIKIKLHHKPPTWADKYEITYKKSNISSFVQYYGALADPNADGIYNFTLPKEIKDLQTEKPKTRENLSAYTYTKGDRIRIISMYFNAPVTYNGLTYLAGNVYYLPEYFDVELYGWDDVAKEVVYLDRIPTILSTNIASLGFVKAEIYTPKKERAIEETGDIYYSIGEVYNIENGLHKGIVDQTENSPAEVILSGGDVFVRTRQLNAAQNTVTLIVESESGTDYHKSQNIWYSKPSLVLQDAKQKLFKSHYRWGGSYIEGSDTSYIKRFLGNDFSNIPEANGGITASVQRGQTLKLIQENKLYSQYIGVSEIADQSGSTSLIKTDRLFGGKKPSDFEYGTQYQNSVIKTPRAIYFVDIQNSAIVADAGNEPQDITIGRVKTFMNYISSQFANCISSEILTTYDNQTQNVLFTFIWTDVVYEQLPVPYGETPETRPTYLKRTKTLVWNESYMQFKGFIDLCKSLTDTDSGAYIKNNTTPLNSLSTLGNTYVSFIGDELWVQDVESRNNLFGEQKKMIISVPSNIGKEKEMVFDSVEIHTNNIKKDELNPDKNWEAIITTLPNGISPNGQKTYINSQLFAQKESLLTANILRDINTIMSGSEMYKLYNGDVVRGESCLVTIQNSSDEEVNIYSVIVKETPSEMSV